jgi:amino acid adenylation domain-containing protein
MKPELIITNQCYEAQLIEIAPECKRLLMEDIGTAEAPASESLPWLYVTDADPFCVITTSGSTGTPKGVVLPHRGYIDNLIDTLDATALHRSVRLASIAPIDFDFFVYEICFIALSGSTMVIIPESYLLFPAKLLQYMQNCEIDYIEWIPSFMVYIAKLDLLSKHSLPSLCEVWYGGEVFPTKHLNYWRRHLPNARFVHFYGPTEASYTCTYNILEREFADGELVPIGKPFQNTRILVLNTCNQPVQGEEEGELCVLGTRLAHGYYNDPEKTERVFVQNPLNLFYPEIMYRTGDIVSYTKDGDILFRGRADTLIKHKGYRIELSEVEHVINALGIVPYACAVYNSDKQEIMLFYEAEQEIPIATLRMQISTALPRYMIPSVFVRLDKLPRNTNDKIDRVCLRCMLSD